jgi:tetratricopeptide (TPR) repeat protein
MAKATRYYRALFALGMALTAASFVTGLVAAWRSEHRLPGLGQSPYVAAERSEQAGDRAAAAREYRAAARLNRASLGETLRAAERLAWLGDSAGAAEMLAEADRRAPGAPRVQAALGWVLLHQRRFDDAERALRRALQSTPEDAHAWAGLGEVDAGRGRYDEAIAAYRRSLAIDPAADVHNGLGIALAESGRPGLAVQEFEAAVALVPSPEYQANLERARSEARNESGGGTS